MKRHIILIITLILSVSWINLSAQQDLYKWRIGVHGGITPYYGDLSTKRVVDYQPTWRDNLDNFSNLSYGLSAEYAMSDAWGVRLLLHKGTFSADDRAIKSNGDLRRSNKYFDRGLNFRNDYFDASLSFIYHFDYDEFLGKQAIVAPYIGIGASWMNFKVKVDQYYKNNDVRYVYLQNGDLKASDNLFGENIERDGDFETEVSKYQTEGKNYNTDILTIPLVTGIKFRITDRLNLNLELQTQFAFSDYLDDVADDYPDSYYSEKQAYLSNPSGYEGKRSEDDDFLGDVFAFANLGVHYNFGYKTQNFIAPRIYSRDFNRENIAPLEKNEEKSTEESSKLDKLLKKLEDIDFKRFETFLDSIENYEIANVDSIIKNELNNTDSSFIKDVSQFTNKTVSRTSSKVDSLVNNDGESDSLSMPKDSVEIDSMTSKNISDSIHSDAVEYVDEDGNVIRDSIISDETERSNLNELTGDNDMELEDLNDKNSVEKKDGTVNRPKDKVEPSYVIVESDSSNTIDTIQKYDAEDNEVNNDDGKLVQSLAEQTNNSEESNDTINELKKEVKTDIEEGAQKVERKVESVIDTADNIDEDEYLNSENSRRLQNKYDEIEREIDEKEKQIQEQNAKIDSLENLSTNLSNDDDRKDEFAKLKKQVEVERQKNDSLQRSLELQSVSYNKNSKKLDSLLNVQSELSSSYRDEKSYASQVDETDTRDVNKDRFESEKRIKELERKLANVNAELKALEANAVLNENRKQESIDIRNKSRLQNSETDLDSISTSRDSSSTMQPRIDFPEDESHIVDTVTTKINADNEELSQLKAKVDELIADKKANESKQIQILLDRIDSLETSIKNQQTKERVIVESKIVPQTKVVERSITLNEKIDAVSPVKVFFDTGKSDYSSDFDQQLDRVRKLLLEYPELNLALIGYTDKSGNYDLNKRLSLKRTESIETYFIRNGIKASRISKIAEGPSQSAGVKDAYGRRVEVIIQK